MMWVSFLSMLVISNSIIKPHNKVKHLGNY